ncbi:MAG: hypothetical protein J0G30_02920 [Actinomycetales bacterium]|nr:hypothetical protein [Actinomycetales bacterium]
MGKLTLDSTLVVEFDDRLLAHLQLVIGAKVRRGESFHFTWKDDPSIGDGRTTVWIHPATPIVYKYFGSRQPTINRAWLEALTLTANSATGLQIVPEPAESSDGNGGNGHGGNGNGNGHAGGNGNGNGNGGTGNGRPAPSVKLPSGGPAVGSVGANAEDGRGGSGS